MCLSHSLLDGDSSQQRQGLTVCQRVTGYTETSSTNNMLQVSRHVTAGSDCLVLSIQTNGSASAALSDLLRRIEPAHCWGQLQSNMQLCLRLQGCKHGCSSRHAMHLIPPYESHLKPVGAAAWQGSKAATVLIQRNQVPWRVCCCSHACSFGVQT